MTGAFLYQQKDCYFAQVAENLEEMAAAELAGLGGQRVNPSYRGVHFNADKESLYRIIYQSRLCSRVLAPLAHFSCHSSKYLYKTAVRLPWEELLSLKHSFKINARVSNSRVDHSGYAALCLKDAIADSFRKKQGQRPDVDTDTPDIVFDLNLHRNTAVISLDLAGESLHRRGYRQDNQEAMLQETLAAAMLELSGWDGERMLIDPFCGSGTILAEALSRRCGIAAGLLRNTPALHRLPDFDNYLWEKIKTKADKAINSLPPGLISGSDIDKNAVKSARRNLSRLPGGRDVEIIKADFRELYDTKNKLIICNPPYGIRLGDPHQAAMLIRELGSFLKHKCKGATACVFFGDRELLKEISLKPKVKKQLNNGGLSGVVACFEMY